MEKEMILKCSQEEFQARFVGLLNAHQLTMSSCGIIAEALIKYNHFVSFDQFRKERHLSEDAMNKKLEGRKTAYLLIFDEK
jgi:hypothetical protein